MRRQVGNQEWHVRPEIAPELLGPDGLPVEEWLAAGLAAVVKDGPHRTVYRLSLPSGVYFLKHYKIAGPRAWFQNNLRPCRAYREAAASARVREAGIETAELTATGRVRTGPFSRDSFFVSREIPGVVPLDEVIRTAASSGWTPAVRRAVTARLAVLTAQLHRAGLYHADYHAGNVLVRRDGDGVTLWLIDLHPLRAARATTARRREMLGMLAASAAPQVTRADRRRFFAACQLELGATEDVREAEAFCAMEVRRRQKRADRKWRRGNRRVLILDRDGVECRGLAELGRETVVRWRETFISKSARREPRPPNEGVVVRAVTGRGAARRAWETGHALLRRGFPTPRPFVFAADRACGIVVTEPAGEYVPLADRLKGHEVPEERAGLLASLGRLLRKLHDAGFDAAPEAFTVCADGMVSLVGIEHVSQRPMWRWRRRAAVARLLAVVAGAQDRAQVLSAYDGCTGSAGPNEKRPGARQPSGSTRIASSPARRGAAAVLLAILAVVGCRSLDKPQPLVSLPAKHSVRADHLLLVSDFKLPKDDPIVDDLVKLRSHVTETLQLPEPRQDVVVYLFADEEAYRKYLDTVHPGLPPRRAYFVGTKKELAVYTYWGDRVLEDLRHEYTHGILHASLAAVPLWLDEGLAEYFEVPGTTPGAMNGDYPQQLAGAVSRGWRPDIWRLEGIDDFSQMQRLDYQESWAWVHYLLHASPDSRQELLAYIGDLRDAEHPPELSERLGSVEPSYPARFLGYVANLNATGGAVIRAASAEL